MRNSSSTECRVIYINFVRDLEKLERELKGVSPAKQIDLPHQCKYERCWNNITWL